MYQFLSAAPKGGCFEKVWLRLARPKQTILPHSASRRVHCSESTTQKRNTKNTWRRRLKIIYDFFDDLIHQAKKLDL